MRSERISCHPHSLFLQSSDASQNQSGQHNQTSTAAAHRPVVARQFFPVQRLLVPISVVSDNNALSS